VFTRTEWYIVPLFWVPIFSVLFLRSALQFAGRPPESIFHSATYTLSILAIPPSAFSKAFACFLVGNVIWTLLEYFLHRFLFHIDKWLPDRPFFLMLHFLLHGIHHYLPMDGYVFRSPSIAKQPVAGMPAHAFDVREQTPPSDASDTFLQSSTALHPTSVYYLPDGCCQRNN
jgi:hypothetical protein